jgi:hypothetical protein
MIQQAMHNLDQEETKQAFVSLQTLTETLLQVLGNLVEQ